MRDELLKKAVKRATDLYGFQPKTDLSNVIYIADTPHDVVAARKANIRCIVPYNGINNKRDWSQNEPELFINSLKEGNKIFEYLERKWFYLYILFIFFTHGEPEQCKHN